MTTEDSPGSKSSDGDSIKVFVRVRPLAKDSGGFDCSLCLEVDNNRNSVIMQAKPEPKLFTFDQVADSNTSQETVFSSVGKKIIESCASGYNGTIFAYGQTGSGKTFTMLGPAENTENFQHELRGVIPRSFEYLFNLIKKEQELHGDKVQFLCKCSFLEIYNEQAFDLLDPASTGLQLRENIKRGVFVDGLIEEAVTDASEAYQVLSAGWMNRTVASTSMNRESSRSHAVFTVHIESKENKNGVWNVRTSQLNLVDLAGSERQKDTNTIGLRLKEAGSINKSLSVLGNVIMALVDIAHGKTRHVPYRDSKLSFLLRDSLGGNAKTYIIACVHPGSRCFGETLSTLMFARRAKMIKNKAVVNEDTHGNMTLLQAEIRRLRETLQQFQQGGIPGEPSTQVGEDGSVVKTTPSHVDAQWRKCFLEAMLFREKSESDKRGLGEKLHRLQETCSRKEQALRQSRMILKFREDALKKLEKAQKEKAELEPEEKDFIIENLRSEMKILQETVDHHPDVTKFRLENEGLLSEMKRLTADKAASAVSQQRSAELDKIFRELRNEKEKDGEVYSTPQQSQSGTANSNVAVATFERQKSQIEKLQLEMATLKREFADYKETVTKELMEREAEAVSLRRGKQELMKTLKAHHIRGQVERETLGEMHMETIKTMTTPKKARYHLRNRTILGPASGRVPQLNLDMDVSVGEDDFILMEGIPSEYSEEQVDALTEEIRKLQEESRILKAQHEDRESQIVRLVEETSKLECHNLQLLQLSKDEKARWAKREEELTTELGSLTLQLKDATFCKEVVTGEVQDLRLMLTASEKRLHGLKVEEKTFKATIEKDIGILETKLMKLGLDKAGLEKELEDSLKEQDRLKESEETLQVTLDFTSSQLAEYELTIESLTKERTQLDTRLQSVVKSVEQKDDTNQQLMTQLEHVGDKNQHLLEALKAQEQYQLECKKLQGQVEALEEHLERRNDQLAEAEEDYARLFTSATEKQEAIGALQASLGGLKEALTQRERDVDNLGRQVQELRQQNETLADENAALETQRERLAKKLEDDVADLNNELQSKMAQLDLNEDEMDGLVSDREQTLQAFQDAQATIEQLQTAEKELKDAIKSADTEKDALQTTVADYKQKLELASREKQEILVKDSELAHLRQELQAQMTKREEADRRLQEVNVAFDTVSGQLEKKTSEVTVLQTSVSEYKHKLELSSREKQEVLVKDSELANCRRELQAQMTRSEEAEQRLLGLHSDFHTASNQLEKTALENIGLQTTLSEYKQKLELASREKQEVLVKDTELANSRKELQAQKTKREEAERRLQELKVAFDTVSRQLDDKTIENAVLQSDMEEIRRLTEDVHAARQHQQTTSRGLEQQVDDLTLENTLLSESCESRVTEYKTLAEQAQQEASAAVCDKVKAVEEASRLSQEYSQLQQQIEGLNSSINEHDTEIHRLREALENRQLESDTIVSEFEQMKERNRLLEETKLEYENRYMQESSANAKLAGHCNPRQKIHYVEKLKEKTDGLVAENAKLKEQVMCLQKEIDKLKGKNGTPQRLVIGGKQGCTPKYASQREGSSTPVRNLKQDVVTPGKPMLTASDNNTPVRQAGGALGTSARKFPSIIATTDECASPVHLHGGATCTATATASTLDKENLIPDA